jgi:hypothetical protein
MVEIRRLDLPESGEPRNKAAEDDDKYRLVYSKSKVYVNPTAYAKDNIPGFVALVKRVSAWILVWSSSFILQVTSRKCLILYIYSHGSQKVFSMREGLRNGTSL